MKRILQSAAVFVVWLIAQSLALWVGDLYMAAVHPDGSTFAGHFWRSLVFGIPDLLILSSHLFISGGAVGLAKLPKVVAVPVLLWGLFCAWQLATVGVLSGQSGVVHWVAAICAVVFGAAGVFGKLATVKA